MIDPFEYARIELPAEGAKLMEERIAALTNSIASFPNTFANDKCDWWPPNQQNVIVSNKVYNGRYYIEAYLVRESAGWSSGPRPLPYEALFVYLKLSPGTNPFQVLSSNIEYWKDGKPVNHDQPAGTVIERASGKTRWNFRGFVSNDFYTLSGAQEGSWLVVLEIPGQPRGAFLLDGATSEVRQRCYDDAHGSAPLSVGMSPDGDVLAAGYAPHDIILVVARVPAAK
jgi:hypothetical protein